MHSSYEKVNMNEKGLIIQLECKLTFKKKKITEGIREEGYLIRLLLTT